MKCDICVYLSVIYSVLVVDARVAGFDDVITDHGQVGPAANEFSRHSVVKPVIYHGRQKRAITSEITNLLHHPDDLTIHLPDKNEELILDLTLNQEIIPDGYFRKIQHNGTHKVEKFTHDQMHLCHYRGKVRGKDESWVALSTCDGVSGVVYDGKHMRYIEKKSEKEFEHYLYHEKDLIKRNSSCGHTKPQNIYRYRRDIKEPYNANEKSRYIELILVVDNEKFKELNSDVQKVDNFCKNIANIMYGIYTPLNIYIALVGVVIWNKENEIDISEYVEETNDRFMVYRREKLLPMHPNDNAQLITKQVFDLGFIGFAKVGRICTVEASGGVNLDHAPITGFTAAIIIHMVGHNLGMDHDNPECDCPDDKCIMTIDITSGPDTATKFSSCSRDELDYSFEHGMDHCLKNVPKRLVQGPTCGNGFIEDGEQCDCGPAAHCNNKCCDATTCKLRDNAKCAAGKCCDLKTCQVKKEGLVCRRAANECDLPEYCTGKSEHCPNDYYKMDTQVCNNGDGYCFQGRCGTRVDQCRLIWGPSGNSADEQCYNLNKRGNRNGHCGYNRIKKTYNRCKNEDLTCGLLHCQHRNDTLHYGIEAIATRSSAFANSKAGNTLDCKSVSLDLGLDTIDPGLVPDGSKCGVGKMCLNQKCVYVEALQQGRSCPYNCYNNGYCNNVGHCHCDIGYVQPYCEHLLPGGSADSGPAYAFTNNFSLL